MTSIHPPLWWKGPLGPLTGGRDLYVVGLLCPAGPVHRAARRDARAVGRREIQTNRDLGDPLSDVRRDPGDPLSDGRRDPGDLLSDVRPAPRETRSSADQASAAGHRPQAA